jgi:hypothetical protein
MTSLLQSPPLVLSEMKSNLRILWDFVFQLNSNFIYNLNTKASELLPHPYISLGAPPLGIHMPILPQNQTRAATLIPPHRRCPSSLPPLFQSPPFKLNHVPVVRNQGPNHRKKNHIKTRSVASIIYRQSLAVVFRRAASFPANFKSIRPYR